MPKYDWCHVWRPPPFPKGFTNDQLEELIKLLRNDKGLKKYKGKKADGLLLIFYIFK